MPTVVRVLAVLSGVAMLTVACASPEATRVRSGGPGADPGNRTATVELHQGADPYYRTPNLIR